MSAAPYKGLAEECEHDKGRGWKQLGFIKDGEDPASWNWDW